MKDFFLGLWNDNTRNNEQNQSKGSLFRSRRLSMEPLENREMLSINSPLEMGTAPWWTPSDVEETTSVLSAVENGILPTQDTPKPEGYNDHDWEKFVAAVEKNGLTDNHVTWEDFGDEWRITAVDAAGDEVQLGPLIGDLDLSGCTELRTVNVFNNQLTELDVSNNPALTGLYCSSNELTVLDVSNNPALTDLLCGSNELTELDVSNNPDIRILACSSNLLTGLDVSNNLALTRLHCSSNELTELDVSNNTALTELSCSYNKLRELDMSMNMALTYLYCYSNELAQLDVSNNTALEILYCWVNELTELNMSNNPALTELYCDSNELAQLDVSNNPALRNLYCENNELTFSTLPLPGTINDYEYAPQSDIEIISSIENDSTFDELASEYLIDETPTEYVWYYDGAAPDGIVSTDLYTEEDGEFVFHGLQNGDVIYCEMTNALFPELTLKTTPITITSEIGYNAHDWQKVETAKANNGLTDEHVTWEEIDGEYRLTAVDAAGNNQQPGPLSGELDLEGCTELRFVDVSFNQLAKLDVSNNTALSTLYCSSNQLAELDVSNNTALTYLECYNNELTELDVSTNTALTQLSCSSNILTELNVSNNAALIYLNCYNNKLTELDVSNNMALVSLYCDSNELTELDVSNNMALTYLSCVYNKLTELDVSNNTALISLVCDTNELTELDVSNNTALTRLECDNNELTELDVSNNTALTELECGNNELTELDVSSNTVLTRLWCHFNELTELDVSNNTALTDLWCENNQLKFSTLPLPKETINDYIYDPQSDIEIISSIENNSTLDDLASESWIGETQTVYKWYYVNGTQVPEDRYTEIETEDGKKEGKFIFHGLENGDVIYCEMTNAIFPSLTLKTTPITITVKEVPPPTDFAAETIDHTTISLRWTASDDAVSYEIQYSIKDHIWMEPTFVSDTENELVSDLLSNTTYDFRIRAINENGESEWVYITASTRPDAPTDLDFTIDYDNNTITLTWLGVDEDIYEYRIYRSIDGTFNRIGTADTVMSYSDENLNPGTYRYYVTAYNGATQLESAASNIVIAIIDDILPSPEITTVTTESSNSIKLSWTTVDGATDYEIQYRKENEVWKNWSSTFGTTETVYWLDSDTVYEFRVRAKDTNSVPERESDWSEPEIGITWLDSPTNFRSTDATYDSVTLEWNPVTGAENYEIQYRLSGNYPWNAGPIVSETKAIFLSLLPNTVYNFRIRAINGRSASEWTNAITESTLPTAPTNFDATVDGRTIYLSWDSVVGVDQYNIYRRFGESGDFVPYQTVSGTDFEDESLGAGTYYYYVTSYNSTTNKESERSGIVHGVIGIPAPDITDCRGTSTTDIFVEWSEVADVYYYEIQHTSTKNASEHDWRTTHASFHWTTVESLEPSTTYYFRVRAYNGTEFSDWSNVAEAKTLDIPLSIPVITDSYGASATEIFVRWSTVSGADRYEIQYMLNSPTKHVFNYTSEPMSGSSTQEESSIFGQTAAQDWITVETTSSLIMLNDLTSLKRYYVRVRACRGTEFSDWSEIEEAKTLDDNAPIAAPSFTACRGSSPTHIYTAWNEVSRADSYEIQYGVNQQNWTSTRATTPFFMINGLTPSTTYYVRIRSCKGSEVSDWSQIEIATTFERNVPVSVPNIIDCQGISTTQIHAAWEEVSEADGYEIEYSADQENWISTQTTSPLFTVDGLTPSTTYYVRVRAYNDSDVSEWNEIQNVSTSSFPRLTNILAVGADAGPLSKPIVQVYDAETGEFLFEIPAHQTYGEDYTGGIRVATGDLNGDGVPDIAVAPGRNRAPDILVFNGIDGTQMSDFSIPASANYGYSFKDGLSIAIGDVTGNDMNDIILVPSGGQAVVQVFENISELNSGYYGFANRPAVQFNAFEDHKECISGASVAVGDVGIIEGKQQIVLGTGPGIAPIVRIYDAENGLTNQTPIQEIKVMSGETYGGINVAVGDIDGDGVSELIVAQKNGGHSLVEIYLLYPESTSRLWNRFQAYDTTEGNNVAINIVVRDGDGDGVAELYMTQGAKGKAGFTIKKMRWNSDSLQPELVDTIFADWSNDDSTGLFLG